MIIGFDIDDTITDTYAVMFGYAQKYTIEELNKISEIDYNQSISNHNYIQIMHNWNKKEEENFFTQYYKKILKETKPFPFAVETINKLKQEGNRIVLITARWDFADVDAKILTERWLEEQKINYDKLVVDANTKLGAAKENKLDVFIDDSFENCREIAYNGIKTFIMDTRCNKNLEDSKIKRIFSWPHLSYVLRKEIN